MASSAINESIGWLSTTGTIDIAGKLRAEKNRARALLAAAHAGTMTARRNLVLATIDTYYGLALTRQKRRLADEALALAEGFASVTQEQQKRGTAGEVDVLRARSAARSRRDELAQAQLSESLAMSQLRVLTGLDYATYITVIRLSADALQDPVGYREDAIIFRPELAQLDALAPSQSPRGAAGAGRSDLRWMVALMRPSPQDGIPEAPPHHAQCSIFNFGASKSRATQADLRTIARRPTQQPGVATQTGFYGARAPFSLDRTGFAAQAAAAAQQN